MLKGNKCWKISPSNDDLSENHFFLLLGAAVLKYLIEKGFIEGEQRNLVTAEGIENAICSLSNQKPITEITFEDGKIKSASECFGLQ